MLYCTEVTYIGEFAAESLQDNMMILFSDNAPSDIADYCYIHPHADLVGDIVPGHHLKLGSQSYLVTAVGNVANQNLASLGHITIRFDGNHIAEYPGTIHVHGDCPDFLAVGIPLIFATN